MDITEQHEKDLMTYISILSELASGGDATAMLYLALTYHYGGYKIDPYPEEASFWLNKAYEKNPTYFKNRLDLLAML